MRTPNFTFSELGINIGEELTFIPTGIVVKVATEREVEYNGKLYKLSPFVSEFIPRKPASCSFRGPMFFLYNGRKLSDIREEVLKAKRDDE